MSYILYSRSSHELQAYPAGVDTARPMVGLDKSLFLTLELIQLDPPEYDELTHQILPSDPVISLLDESAEISGTATVGWTVEPIPPAKPAPDFAQFQHAIRTENGFTAAFLTASASDPFAAASLTSRFDDFRKDGDYLPFLQSISLVLQALPADHAAEIGIEFYQLAIRCNMPQSFVEAVRNAFFSP